jgi:hypothetical protein
MTDCFQLDAKRLIYAAIENGDKTNALSGETISLRSEVDDELSFAGVSSFLSERKDLTHAANLYVEVSESV